MNNTPRTETVIEAFKEMPGRELIEMIQHARCLEIELELARREAGFARLAYDQLVARYEQGIERAKGCARD